MHLSTLRCPPPWARHCSEGEAFLALHGCFPSSVSSARAERPSAARLVRRKTLLLAGQLVCAVSAAAFGLVTLLSSRAAFLAACIVLRVINGLGSAAVDTASFAIVSRWALKLCIIKFAPSPAP